MIRSSESPWDETEETLRQEFRDKIIPICEEYSEIIGEHGVLSEFFGAIVAYLITNDFVRDEASAASFGHTLADALRVALTVRRDLGQIALMQGGNFDA